MLLDKHGNATNDPAAMWTQAQDGDANSRQGGLTFQDGCLMPFGLHKGSGLSLICALLAGGTTGGGTERPEHQEGPGPILNHVFAVFIDPEAIERSGGPSVASMKDEMRAFIEYQPSLEQPRGKRIRSRSSENMPNAECHC